jgi:DNA-directed RNA polymerase subunit RPC12/RpoP
MRIHVTCDCGQKLELGEAMAGRTTKCPECGREVAVPGEPPAGGGAGGVTFERAPASAGRQVLAFLLFVGAVVSAFVLYKRWDAPMETWVKAAWTAATGLAVLLALVVARRPR